MASRVIDDPIDPTVDSVTPCLWSASVAAASSPSSPGRCAPVASVVEPVALSLGVDLSVGAESFIARFCVLAPSEREAVAAARRRWFYLAEDLELPAWPLSGFSVTIADQPVMNRIQDERS